MNANQISYPARRQSFHLWTPLLAAVLLAIALIVGAAGIAALTAKSGTASPAFVPQTINAEKGPGALRIYVPHTALKVATPVYVPHTSLKVATPAFVPQSINSKDHAYNPVFYPQTVNSHDHDYSPTILGVPFPGGVAGPSQLDRFRSPGMGGH